jgi:hypothetical protein
VQTTAYKGSFATLQSLIDSNTRKPSATVKIDWNKDGDYSDANEDISADVKSISLTREMQESDPSILVKGYVAADLDIELINADKYSKYESTGYRYNSEIEGLPIQVAVGYNDNEVQIFEGRVKKLQLDRIEKTAHLYCFDMSQVIKTNPVSTDIITDIPSDAAIEILLIESGIGNYRVKDSSSILVAPLRGTLLNIIDYSYLDLAIGEENPFYQDCYHGRGLTITPGGKLRYATAAASVRTVCFWINPTIDIMTGVSEGKYLFHDGGIKLYGADAGNLILEDSNGNQTAIVLGTLVTNTNGYFIAASWKTDGDAASDFLRLYFYNYDTDTASTDETIGINLGDVHAAYLHFGAKPDTSHSIDPDMSLGETEAQGIYAQIHVFNSGQTLSQLGQLRTYGKNYDLAEGQNTLPYLWFNDADAWSEISKIAEAEQGRIYFDECGKFCFKNKYSLIVDTDSKTSQVTITGTTLGKDYDLIENIEDVFNYITVESKGRTKDAAITDLWTYGGAPEGVVNDVPPGGTIEIWAELDNPCQREDFVTPVATTDYVANTIKDGTGQDLTSSISIVVTLFSQKVLFTITNSSSVAGCFLTTLKIRGKAIREQATIKGLAEDTTSQGQYGKRMLSVSNDYIITQAQANNLAGYYLQQYKDPVPKVEGLSIKPIPYLQLGDRITLTDSEYYHVNHDYWVKKIGMNVKPGVFEMDCELIKSDTRDWGIYGTGLYGTAVYTY